MICDAINGHVGALLCHKRLSVRVLMFLLLVINFVLQLLIIVHLVHRDTTAEMVEVVFVLRKLRQCDLGG